MRTVVDEARAAGAPHAVAIPVDIADGTVAAHMAGDAAEALDGPVDIFVHAAGVAGVASLAELDPDVWRRTFAINVDAAMRIMQAVTGAMVERGFGRIVTVASLRARVGVPTTAAYTASKHALLGLTRVTAAEYARAGVTANAVVPGWVDTEMVRDEIVAFADRVGMSRENAERRLLREQQIGRIIRPDEVAGLIGYLCSDEAAAVTGQAVHIDGGSYQA